MAYSALFGARQNFQTAILPLVKHLPCAVDTADSFSLVHRNLNMKNTAMKTIDI